MLTFVRLKLNEKFTPQTPHLQRSTPKAMRRTLAAYFNAILLCIRHGEKHRLRGGPSWTEETLILLPRSHNKVPLASIHD